ncbi:glutathione S-transferase family protein [Endozoicomonadaceae bacterium StTr2]
MTTVYGIQLSPFARKVILALEAKGVEFQINPVTPMNKPEGFEKISPLKKIPALQDDLVTLADSTVICEYLEQRYPQNPLYPEDLVARARARWFEEFSDTSVLAVAGPLFFERVVKKVMMKQEADEARVSQIVEEELPKVYGYLEQELSEAGFIAGETLSVADLALGSNLINAMYAGVDVDSARWPKLAAYKNRLFSTELFANRLASDKAMMSA